MAATAWDTYAEQLMDQGHGYPLWDPEPTGNGEVEIGDVGFIRRGRFHRLFSARYTADHPLNETWGVPDDFVPLHIANGFIVEKQSAIASDSLHSGSFHKLAVGGEVHAGSATDISLLYQCVDDKGAVLVLPTKHANSQELLETGGVYKYIQRNHTSWYHFATEKADILVKKEDIIFVTGWTKTSRWAVGAFASGGKAVELSLTVGYEAHAHATFNLSSSTGSSKSWYQHSGPIPEAVDNDRPLSGQRTSERGRGRGRRNRGRSIPPSRKLDQCIFLRFCQCKERLRGILPSLLPKVINAAAGPKDDERDGEGDSESMSPQTTVESESYIESYPRTPQWYNPVDCVLDHILQNSDASVAIASTTDAAALARSMSTPVQDLPSALRSQGLDMIVSDGGLGALTLCSTKSSLKDFFYVLPLASSYDIRALGLASSSSSVPAGPGPREFSAVDNRTTPISNPCLACKYAVNAPLYKNGYCTVMEAVHVRTGHIYACKVIRTSPVHDKMPDEIEVLQSLSQAHPNIIGVEDLIEINDQHLIFLQWCSGGTLTERLRKYGPHNELDAIRIVRTIIDGVKYLHRHGIAHRGLTLHSVLCRTQDLGCDVVLAGFSDAKFVRRLGDSNEADTYESMDTAFEEFSRDIHAVAAIALSLLSGFIPPDRVQLSREQILGSCKDMLAESALHITENAQDFIAECLDMSQTADKAAKHPWLGSTTPQLKRTPNDSRTGSRSSSRISGRRERRFDARRKFRTAVHVMVAMSRMQHSRLAADAC